MWVSQLKLVFSKIVSKIICGNFDLVKGQYKNFDE